MNRLMLCLQLCAALSMAACGGPGGETGTDAGTDSGPVVTDSGPVVTDSGPMCKAPADYTTAVGQCTNGADLAVIFVDPAAAPPEYKATYGNTGDQTVSDVAGNCGKVTCLADPDYAGCVATCVATETGLSAECGGCYAASVSCAKDNCIVPCLTGTPAECDACRTGTNDCSLDCTQIFIDCAGF